MALSGRTVAANPTWLRHFCWVMGEKSAKNMRGGGMEDVIFAGTSKRPARNMVEVTVVMNNEDGSAPSHLIRH